MLDQIRDRLPQYWANIKNELDVALNTPTAQESASLEQTVTAYRETLKKEHNRMPLQSAIAQNNLGNVLATFGARDSNTIRLQQAIQAYGVALEEIRKAGETPEKNILAEIISIDRDAAIALLVERQAQNK